ncbi:MAG: type II toxin-antitoxin system VapC family toxin [Saprospiraceae bacterium]|nr:type II toxin-antitoxin system VapC family toxin [Saprospiraceae bacterium]
MRYLLDTHTLLWIAYDQHKLSKEVVAILQNTNNEFLISAVSVWEINIKFSIGKLTLKEQTPKDLFDGFTTFFRCSYLDLNLNDTLNFYNLKTFHHRDPFDRMMVWQAIQNNLTFITDDEQIHKYTDCGLKVVWK